MIKKRYREKLPPRLLSSKTFKHTPGLCKWCGQDVKRYQASRRTFCSDACVHEWKLRSDPNYAALLVFQRDHGICSLCGLDTCRLLAELLFHVAIHLAPRWSRDPEGALNKAIAITKQAHRFNSLLTLEERTTLAAKQIEYSFFEQNNLKPIPIVARRHPIKRLWEADHIIPVYKGGGLCGLDNFRTLCIWCHKTHTAEQAKQRSIERAIKRKLI